MRVRHRSRTRRGNVKQRRKPIIAAFACAIAIAATAAMTVSMRANAASVSSPGSLAVGQGNINYVETGDTSSHGYGMPITFLLSPSKRVVTGCRRTLCRRMMAAAHAMREEEPKADAWTGS